MRISAQHETLEINEIEFVEILIMEQQLLTRGTETHRLKLATRKLTVVLCRKLTAVR